MTAHGAEIAGAGGAREVPERRAAWLDRSFPERMNPVVVKELRAALRGRYFRILFPVMLLIAALVAVFVLFDHVGRLRGGVPDPSLGLRLFEGVFQCLVIAVNGIVPFSAFLSMGNEWDEHTYDLLVISNLRPRQIVLGKLFTVAVESALYLSAFAPFLACAFLLRGIGLATILVMLVGAAVSSLSCSAMALLLSSLSHARMARVLLMALLAAVVYLISAALLTILSSSGVGSGSAAWSDVALYFALIALPGLLSFAAATGRLAHVEENASTMPRVMITALLVLALGCGWAYHVTSPFRDWPVGFAALCLILVGLCDLFFVTEAEPLSRRVRLDVPRQRWRALLAVPFLPGGGRGVALFLLHVAMILAAMMSMMWSNPVATSTSAKNSGAGAALVFAAFVASYLLLPSLVASRSSARARVRLATRVIIPVGALASIFLPALLGFFFGIRAWMDMDHPLNPVWRMRHVSGAGPQTGGELMVLAFAFVLVAANGPRVARSVAEVLAASAERREHQESPGEPIGARDAA